MEQTDEQHEHFDVCQLLTNATTTLVDSQDAQKGVLSWDIPTPVDFETRQSCWQNITVAIIGSARLYHGLSGICDALALTPKNWRDVRDILSPKILLIDSFFISFSGAWHLQQFGKDHTGIDALSEIIAAYQAKGIPVVFWNTFDVRYQNKFDALAAQCDLSFYSDQHYDTQAKAQSRYSGGYLPPACAPARQSPIMPLQATDVIQDRPAHSGIGAIIFDGWASYLRNKDALAWVEELPSAKLKIVDANYRLFRNQLKSTGKLAKSVLGCVTRPSLWSLWRQSDAALFSDHRLASPHSQQWDMMEAASCGAALFAHGQTPQEHLFGTTTITAADGSELREAMLSCLSNPIELLRQQQLGWRQAQGQHSFAHRMQTICDQLGIPAQFISHPKLTILAVTFRLDFIVRILDHYDVQTYPNKELVIVVNSNSIDPDDIAALIGDRPDVRFDIVPAERVEAGSLNHGIRMARGDYIVKMDDDDIYGPYYAADMLLHANALNLDLFGKANRFFYFSDLEQTYVRHKKSVMSRVTSENLLKAHIGGATLSGKAEFFRANPYPEGNFSATDTHYYSNLRDRVDGRFATLDDSGFIYWRRAASEHSWQMDNDKLLAGMNLIAEGIPKDILA